MGLTKNRTVRSPLSIDVLSGQHGGSRTGHVELSILFT